MSHFFPEYISTPFLSLASLFSTFVDLTLREVTSWFSLCISLSHSPAPSLLPLSFLSFFAIFPFNDQCLNNKLFSFLPALIQCKTVPRSDTLFQPRDFNVILAFGSVERLKYFHILFIVVSPLILYAHSPAFCCLLNDSSIFHI